MPIYHKSDLTLRTFIHLDRDDDGDNRYAVGYELWDENDELVTGVAGARNVYNAHMALEHASSIRASEILPRPTRELLLVSYDADGTRHDTVQVDIFEHSMDEIAAIMDNMIETALVEKPRLRLVE